jgi:hypothetical protein
MACFSSPIELKSSKAFIPHGNNQDSKARIQANGQA